MPEFLFHTTFWLAVLQIIAIDVLLGGDNAIVIALACRKLPESQRNMGIAWGIVGAIALRIVLIFFALQLLALPFVKIVGALLLLWIGIKLLNNADDADHDIDGVSHLLGAIRTIIVADAVMSIDNVVAVAGAAKGNLWLVAFGIVASIPIIVFGSKLIMALMTRFPVVVTAGAAMLGWIAGDMLVEDVALAAYMGNMPPVLHLASAASGAATVVLAGHYLARRAGPG